MPVAISLGYFLDSDGIVREHLSPDLVWGRRPKGLAMTEEIKLLTFPPHFTPFLLINSQLSYFLEIIVYIMYTHIYAVLAFSGFFGFLSTQYHLEHLTKHVYMFKCLDV